MQLKWLEMKYLHDIDLQWIQHLLMIAYVYSIKQPDLYYFEAMKMLQAWSNYTWRIRATGEYSLGTLTKLVMSFLWFHRISIL